MKIIREKIFALGAVGARDKVEEAAEELGRKLGKAYKQTKSKLTSVGTEVKNKVGDVAEELGYKLGKATKWVKKICCYWCWRCCSRCWFGLCCL